jgi:orotate phosphoribosyltransferase
MTFSQDAFNQFIIDNNVIGFFDKPLKLKSGRISNWYVNWRTVSEDVFLLETLVPFVIDFTKVQIERGVIPPPDCFYGVPEGATKLGMLCQYFWAKNSPAYGRGSHVLPMGRAKPKEHGAPQDRYFVGAPRGKTIVVEDVTTTGGSLIETIDKLLNAGIDVIAAIGLTHRMELREDRSTVADEIGKRKSASGVIKYLPLSSATELLPLITAQRRLSIELQNAIIQEFVEYGEQPLSL